jgi:osmotically inducible protein OsmC
MPVKHGSAVWAGGLKDGRGRISTESGALTDQPYGFNTRFADKPGTNPEELIGAAHAACFSMALANILGEDGIVPDEIATTSSVTLDAEDLTITRAALNVTLKAAAEESKLRAAAEKAKAGCPVSKLLKAEITMTLKLG